MRAECLCLFGAQCAVVVDAQEVAPLGKVVERLQRPKQVEPVILRGQRVDFAAAIGRVGHRGRAQDPPGDYVAVECRAQAVAELPAKLEDQPADGHPPASFWRSNDRTFRHNPGAGHTAQTTRIVNAAQAGPASLMVPFASQRGKHGGDTGTAGSIGANPRDGDQVGIPGPVMFPRVGQGIEDPILECWREIRSASLDMK